MRKLMYVTIGFAAACGLMVYTENTKVRLICAAAVLLVGAAAGKDPKPVQRALLVLLGCMAGWFWFGQYQTHYLQNAISLDGRTEYVEIRASDYSFETKYGSAVDGSIQIEGKPYQVRVYLRKNWSITPGDYLYGEFRFRITTKDGMETATYHQGKGIFLLAYQAGAASYVDYAPTRRDTPALLRQRIKEVLEKTFSEQDAAFAKALLIGDTNDLDYETLTDFSISGIRHILAVSGLHVSILFALVSAITFRQRFLTALAGYPALLIFAAAAGFSPSVTRACIMSALMLLAVLVNQEYDGPTALSFAVLVILVANPLAVTSVSLQLSAVSVAGIFLFHPLIHKWVLSRFGDLKGNKGKATLANWLASSISVSLSAMILTIPLSAWYFGVVSLLAPVTNLLVLWVISFIFYGIIAVCLLSVVLPSAAAFLAKLLSWPISYVLWTADTMAEFPLAAVYTKSPYIVIWLVFIYLLLAVFLCSGRRKPALFSLCAAAGLCAALTFGWKSADPSEVCFTVLDVGQGQCLLFQTEGKTYMVDCGGDSDTETADLAAETLLSQGIFRLDGLILTHFDWDHDGALAHLLSRVKTDLLILPPGAEELKNQLSGTILCPEDVVTLQAGSAKITVYPPVFPEKREEMNLCILFDTEKCDILVTGDLYAREERELLLQYSLPDVDILVAGHHGSKYSTCEEFLAAVQPETVCISVGADNSYGHPAPELLDRLEMQGCSIFRTDLQGTILIRR